MRDGIQSDLIQKIIKLLNNESALEPNAAEGSTATEIKWIFDCNVESFIHLECSACCATSPAPPTAAIGVGLDPELCEGVHVRKQSMQS